MSEFFGEVMDVMFEKELDNAKWTMAPSEFASPVIVRTFDAVSGCNASIALASLGFCRIYINGERVSDAAFLPLHSIYHDIDLENMLYPIHDKFTFRAYYSVFDISKLLKNGENILEIHLGNGFYRQSERVAEGDWRYGDSLGAKYVIAISDGGGDNKYIYSDLTEVARDSAIVYSELFTGEIYDARVERDRNYKFAKTTEKLLENTKLTLADSPYDKIVNTISPTLIYEDGERKVYDVGICVSGYARIRVFANDSDRVVVRYSEDLNGNRLDFCSAGASYECRSGRKQIMEDVFIGDGNEHVWEPTFVWHAFRYFEVEGDAEPQTVLVIHSDTPVTAEFNSSSPELNWLYDAFIRTQLNNMHLGFPSDCPHRERLGYTGDGQICSLAAMTLINSKGFYRKWIRDIFDSQDVNGGHVSHTAPFAGGGGGPVGWGGAAITVPYNYYKVFGDKTPLYENYDGMKKYVNYLISRSEDGLITREEDGGWVLGDWCTLDECKIPAPLVNTLLFARYLGYLEEIASAIGKQSDVPDFKAIRERILRAVKERYYDESTGSLASGIQGADAYGLYVEPGDERTRRSLIDKYEALGHFDTGFIGTYVLLDVLFESGYENLAYKLLTGHGIGSFGYMMDRGATTVWEHWLGEGSHCHPMFGACAVYLFNSLLGIGQDADSYGYERIVISPKIPDGLDEAYGSILTVKGRISVRFKRDGKKIEFTVEIPEGVSALFEFRGTKELLTKSENIIHCEVQYERYN